MIVRVLLFRLGKRQAGLSSLELDSAGSDNQVLTVLCSGKETRVTQTYGKKAVDNDNNGKITAGEPTKLLTVSMLLVMFKQPFSACFVRLKVC